MLELARAMVEYEPDAQVLVEAIRAEPDWFDPQDKEHFLKETKDPDMDFRIGTPEDLIQSIKDDFTLPSI